MFYYRYSYSHTDPSGIETLLFQYIESPSQILPTDSIVSQFRKVIASIPKIEETDIVRFKEINEEEFKKMKTSIS